MKILSLVFIIILFTSLTHAQQTRTEKTNITNSYDDSKENSDSIPNVYVIDTKFKDILILRFKFKTDLLAGINQIVEEKKIKNAVIISGIGSVRNYHYHTVSNDTFPSKNIFVKDPKYPADLVGISGYIIEGRVHAHVEFADADKSFGGHLEPGTEVFTFGIVTIGILDEDTDLSHLDDKNYR